MCIVFVCEGNAALEAARCNFRDAIGGRDGDNISLAKYVDNEVNAVVVNYIKWKPGQEGAVGQTIFLDSKQRAKFSMFGGYPYQVFDQLSIISPNVGIKSLIK